MLTVTELYLGGTCKKTYDENFPEKDSRLNTVNYFHKNFCPICLSFIVDFWLCSKYTSGCNLDANYNQRRIQNPANIYDEAFLQKQRLKVVYCFRNKASLQMFGWVLNTPLTILFKSNYSQYSSSENLKNSLESIKEPPLFKILSTLCNFIKNLIFNLRSLFSNKYSKIFRKSTFRNP